jgi:hypothetical protein
MVVPMTLSLLVLLAGCAATPTHLQVMADEGIQLRKRVNFSSSPEAKLQMAQDLVAHAAKYDQLINRSIDPAYLLRAHRFQQDERDAALTLMREAAEDYMVRKDVARARATYESVVSTFWEADQRPIRESAEASLTRLEKLETGMPSR